MSRKVGVGIIGCGFISNYHISGLQEIPEVELVAICDTDQRRAKSTARKYEVSEWYADYHDVLQKDDIEAILILTPNFTHCEIALAAAEAGKHMFVQKPLARNTEEAERMIEAAQKAGVKLVPSFMHRYFVETIKAKEYISAGKIGKVLMARMRNGVSGATWASWFFDQEKSGGGAVIDIGIHGIDLSRYLVGEIKNVSARIGSLKKIRTLDDGSRHVLQNEDCAVATYEFVNDALGVHEVSWSQTNGCKRFEAEIYGEEGTIFLRTSMGPLAIASSRLGPANEWTIPELPYYPMGYLQHKAFVDCIVMESEPEITAEDGLAAIKVVEAIYESAREGRIIQT